MADFWDSEELIAEVPKGRDQIHVKAVTKKGKAYVDVRVFYLNDIDEWAPTSKGVTIPVDKAEDITNAIRIAFEKVGGAGQ